MDEKPNYIAILPASVRYDNNLSPLAIILYGEITALSNKEGYCWASNKYFADLYNKHEVTISKLISQLQNRGHVRLVFFVGENGTKRQIYPNLNPHKIITIGVSKNAKRGVSKNAKSGVSKNAKRINK